MTHYVVLYQQGITEATFATEQEAEAYIESLPNSSKQYYSIEVLVEDESRTD